MRTVEKYKNLIAGISVLAGLTGCEDSPAEKYEKIEKIELSSGVRYDSLFKGIYLTMPRKEFLDYCFNMNLQGEFRQGGIKNGMWVECKLKNVMKYPAAINFFPRFKDNEITEMDASIYYDHASFPDKVFDSDSLFYDVLHLMEDWYGPGFIRIQSPYFYKEDIFVKVDGNRRITLYQDQSEHIINLWFVDLLAKNEEEEKKD